MGVLADSLRPDGPAAAAVLAAGVGTFVTGVLTALAPASECLRNFLTWYKPAGPLSGKTAGGLVVWLAVWLILSGLIPLLSISIGGSVMAILAVAAGVLILFGR